MANYTYTQDFYGLDRDGNGGTRYTVEINNVQTSAAPPLAAEPFETTEDKESDLFLPVRTQSGYVRMLLSANSSAWKQFVPNGATDMPVKLKQGDSVVWQGYVQTGTYGIKYPSLYETFDLPLVCPLSALDAFNIDATAPADVVTVGDLIAHLLGKLSGLTFTVYFSCSVADTVNTWLGYNLQWRNFVNVSNGVRRGRFSCLGILEELCKFFGWSCRSHGDGIYFTSIVDSTRNTQFVSYSVSGLSSRVRLGTVSMNTLTVDDTMFANTEQSEEIVPGCKTVTVKSELNAYQVLLEPPYNDLLKKYKYNTPYTAIHWTDAPSQEGSGVYILQRSDVLGAESYEDDVVAITTYKEATDNNEPQCYGRLIIYDPTMDDPKLSYNWTVAFECFRSYDYGNRQSSEPLFTMESKESFMLSTGVLYINGGSDAKTGYALNATCRIRIGNKYWNGSAWTTTQSTFTLTCGTQGIKDTDTNVEASYDGTGISINGQMAGVIKFEVLDVIPNQPSTVPITIPTNGYLPLIRFKVGFVRSYEDTDLNSLDFTANGGQFPEEVTVDTIFSSDKTAVANNKTHHCHPGFGLLLSDNGVVDTIPYNGANNAKPEDHNAGMMALYGQSTKRTATIDLKTSVIGTDIGPLTRVTFDGSTFHPVAVEHDWWDDVTTLKLMQI